jgi:hypothetical protein
MAAAADELAEKSKMELYNQQVYFYVCICVYMHMYLCINIYVYICKYM